MRATRFGLLLLLTLSVVGCGDGVIKLFGGSGNNNGANGNDITVQGNIRSVFVDNALRDIVVFVYTNVEKGAQLPYSPSQFDAVRTVAISSDAATRDFTVTNVSRGRLQVVFLQDSATDPDGSIDPDDVDPTPGSTTNAVATLDAGSRLDSIRSGSTVTIEDIDIDLPNSTADQVIIRVTSKPDSQNP